MNEPAQRLIDKKREKIRKLKDQHLINLGLVDNSKSKKVEDKAYTQGDSYDEEKQVYWHYDSIAPIELTDEEFEELCKYYPMQDSMKTNESDNKMKEDISNIRFWVIFWSVISIISLVIFVFTLMAG